MFYIINQVLDYPLMNAKRIYKSLAKLFEIVEFPRGDELKRRKETLETT